MYGIWKLVFIPRTTLLRKSSVLESVQSIAFKWFTKPFSLKLKKFWLKYRWWQKVWLHFHCFLSETSMYLDYFLSVLSNNWTTRINDKTSKQKSWKMALKSVVIIIVKVGVKASSKPKLFVVVTCSVHVYTWHLGS